MSETMPTLKFDGVVAWMPVTAAAVELGVSHQRVYQLLKGGQLAGIKISRTWFVTCRSVKARIALLDSEGGE